MKKYFSAILLISLSFNSFAKAIVDIPSIAGKSKSEVNEVLGSSTACSSSKHGEKCIYTTGEVEIVFIDGKADWITVDGIDDFAFNSKVLSALGFEEVKPDFASSYTLRWFSVKGALEVSVFKGANNADYAYIKITTK